MTISVPSKIIFASSNKNKIKEIIALLPESIILKGLQDIGITHEIPEPGTTIKENSFLKAKYVIDFLKDKSISVFADDSGLEVEALNNAPGVYSARYAGFDHQSLGEGGKAKNDEANNKKLLHELKNFTNRKAKFVTVITLITDLFPDSQLTAAELDEAWRGDLGEKLQVFYFEGQIKGTIAFEPRGTSGFGYDPLFIPQGYRSTFAELGAEVKNTISHRAIAVKKLIEFLEKVKS